MLTRQGWATLAATAASFATGRVFGLLELYVVGAALGVALVLALVAVNRRLPTLMVRRVVRPVTVAVGEPARVDIQVANHGRGITPVLHLWEPVGEHGGAPMQLAPLGAGEAATAAYRVPTNRRGLLQIGPLRAERGDVLGLSQRVTWLAGSDEVLVVPERIPLALPTAGSSGRLGQHLRVKSWGQTGTEFHSQREYTPGDDLRRINWKTSAKSNTLIVRETALEGVRRCVVLLDTDAEHYHAESFERAVTAAASVVSTVHEAGISTRLVAHGVDLRGPDVTQHALRFLAIVEPGPDVVDYGATSRAGGEGLGLVVLISGRSLAPAVGTTAAAVGPDETLVVITTSDPPGGAARFAVDGTTLEGLRTGWNALIHGQAALAG